MKIVLLGYMGSGKSSVGKELALSLDYNFKDLDLEIEKVEEKKIADIFLGKGEIYFRKRENSILKEVLAAPQNLVLATGGGTACYGDSLEYLLKTDEVITVYLKQTLQTLSHRLFIEKNHRPLIAHLKSEEAMTDFVRKHLFERSYYYSQAKLIVDGSGATVPEIVEKIISKLF